MVGGRYTINTMVGGWCTINTTMVAQMLPLYFVLRVFSEYRVHFVLRVLEVWAVLKAWILGVLGVWAVPKAWTLRVREYPQYRTPQYLEYREYPYYRIPKYCEYSQCILPKYCRYSMYSSCSPRKYFAPTSTCGTVCESFMPENGTKLSKRCGDGRTITYTPSILRIFREFWYCEYSKVWAVRDPEILQVHAVLKSIEPQNTSSAGSNHSIEPRNTASMEVSESMKTNNSRSTRSTRSIKARNTASTRSTWSMYFPEILYSIPRYWEHLWIPCTWY